MPSHPSLAGLEYYLQRDEEELLSYLANNLPGYGKEAIAAREELGNTLAKQLGQQRRHSGGIDALLAEFPIDQPEGRALLELTEALPRIPDAATQDALIREKLQQANWRGHTGTNSPWLVRLAGWALQQASDWSASSAGESIVRPVLRMAIQQLGQQFVIAEDIHSALFRRDPDFQYSFDMLGEAALSFDDADRYFAKYLAAIHAAGNAGNGAGPRMGPGISIKLSALHPRYHPLQREQVLAELLPRLFELACAARDADIGLTLDAEESERLLLSLDLFERLALSPSLQHWDGLGLAVQAYQTRAPGVIDWLVHLAHRRGSSLMVRLVKGAYWDTEIKRAQTLALPRYPVFTRKQHTDLCYEFCASRLLAARNWIYPQFATHNPHTIAMVRQHADPAQDYEFQCLYGMGESLYRLLPAQDIRVACRVYAPVGEQASLLPYLVRRLLENGANTSFLHQLHTQHAQAGPAGTLPAPDTLFAPRTTLHGLDLNAPQRLQVLRQQCIASASHHATAAPVLAEGIPAGHASRTASNPGDHSDTLGSITLASPLDIERALASAALAYQPPGSRDTTAWLEQTATLLDAEQPQFLQLLMREAGKTLANAIGEVREAIDFCRYYAVQARQNWSDGPLQPLGILAVISPWNFPLAILCGQIAAALATGNRVIAKPAPQTALTAMALVHLMHRAGVPRRQLQLLPGGSDVGAALCSDPRLAGVLFTGSLPSAQHIREALARDGSPRLLIAETGGINVMLVDSSAHLDQVALLALESAFDSAGQRCSALRVLCVQSEIADALWHRLAAGLQTLVLGDAWNLDTDVGPVIDAAARERLEEAIARLLPRSLRSSQLALPLAAAQGHFVPPTLLELEWQDWPAEELFGPVLCLIRYERNQQDAVLARLRQQGFGLTLSIASRLAGQAENIIRHSHVGNYYVNRNQIGALVESQPFGGSGKSGTGPKAGGCWLLWRLVQDGCPPAPQTGALPDELAALIRAELPEDEAGTTLALLAGYPHLGDMASLPTPPAVTGEQNRYGHRPLGRILCPASADADRLHQLGAALLTGNQPLLADTDQHRRWQQALPQISLTADPHPEPLGGILACTSDYATREHQWALTAKDLLPVIPPGANGRYPWFRLRQEYAVCINTAAVGGNADLLGKAME